MIHSDITATEAVDIDRASVAVVLEMLDARRDRLSAVAARIIRNQEVTILSLDNKVVEAEWRVLSHAVEIERMADHRYAMVVASVKRKSR